MLISCIVQYVLTYKGIVSLWRNNERQMPIEALLIFWFHSFWLHCEWLKSCTVNRMMYVQHIFLSVDEDLCGRNVLQSVVIGWICYLHMYVCSSRAICQLSTMYVAVNLYGISSYCWSPIHVVESIMVVSRFDSISHNIHYMRSKSLYDNTDTSSLSFVYRLDRCSILSFPYKEWHVLEEMKRAKAMH